MIVVESFCRPFCGKNILHFGGFLMIIYVSKDQSVYNRAFRCTRSHWMTKSPGYGCIRQAECYHTTDFSPSASSSKQERTIVTDHETQGVPIHLKTTMTIREAAQYSNIGINKIEAMLKQPNCPFVLYIGTRKLVKRKAFEAFLEERIVI